jgi:hypothetical protein
MDAIALMVQAIAAGAIAGLKPTAERAVSDTYAAVKALLRRKDKQIDLDQLEQEPGSKARQALLHEHLARADAAQDPALVALVKQLIDNIQQYDPGAAQTVGVSIDGLTAGALRIADVDASSQGVVIKATNIAGEVDIRGVRAIPRGPKSEG